MDPPARGCLHHTVVQVPRLRMKGVVQLDLDKRRVVGRGDVDELARWVLRIPHRHEVNAADLMRSCLARAVGEPESNQAIVEIPRQYATRLIEQLVAMPDRVLDHCLPCVIAIQPRHDVETRGSFGVLSGQVRAENDDRDGRQTQGVHDVITGGER